MVFAWGFLQRYPSPVRGYLSPSQPRGSIGENPLPKTRVSYIFSELVTSVFFQVLNFEVLGWYDVYSGALHNLLPLFWVLTVVQISG